MYRILPDVLQLEFPAMPAGVPDLAITALDPMTLPARVDEVDGPARRSELPPCSIVVRLGKCPERSRSNAP